MAKFKVTVPFWYTSEFEVEAEDEEDAIHKLRFDEEAKVKHIQEAEHGLLDSYEITAEKTE